MSHPPHPPLPVHHHVLLLQDEFIAAVGRSLQYSDVIFQKFLSQTAIASRTYDGSKESFLRAARSIEEEFMGDPNMKACTEYKVHFLCTGIVAALSTQKFQESSCYSISHYNYEILKICRQDLIDYGIGVGVWQSSGACDKSLSKSLSLQLNSSKINAQVSVVNLDIADLFDELHEDLSALTVQDVYDKVHQGVGVGARGGNEGERGVEGGGMDHKEHAEEFDSNNSSCYSSSNNSGRSNQDVSDSNSVLSYSYLSSLFDNICSHITSIFKPKSKNE